MDQYDDDMTDSAASEQTLAVPTKQEALERKIAEALAPHNPALQLVAKKLHLKPETLIGHIKRDLPAPVEQYVYLQLARDFSIRPETLKKILREILGDQVIQVGHLDQRKVGENLAIRPIDRIAEKIEAALNFLHKLSIDYQGLRLGSTRIAQLISVYDIEDAEALVDSIVSNLCLVRERLHMSNKSDNKVIRAGIYFCIECIENDPTLSNITDIRSFFEDQDDLMRRFILQEMGEGDDE